MYDGWITVRVCSDSLKITHLPKWLPFSCSQQWMRLPTALLAFDGVIIVNINLFEKYVVILGFYMKLSNDTWHWHSFHIHTFSLYVFNGVYGMPFVHNWVVSCFGVLWTHNTLADMCFENILSPLYCLMFYFRNSIIFFSRRPSF